jgi:hypothetical protein
MTTGELVLTGIAAYGLYWWFTKPATPVVTTNTFGPPANNTAPLQTIQLPVTNLQIGPSPGFQVKGKRRKVSAGV